MLKATVPIATSLTNVFTIPIEQVGDYYWTAQLWVVHVSATGFTATPGFDGSASPIGWSERRHTTTAVATSLHSSFQATTSSLWINGQFNGFFRATTPGDFTLGCTRTGGTSSTIQIASNVEMFLVE
jgi:hypothetical protein